MTYDWNVTNESSVHDQLGESERACVLVVDDVAENCSLYRELLVTEGFRVIEANDGAAAVAMAAAERPDVIVMDLAMPVMDGYEATRRIRADARTSTIAIVAVTASGGEYRGAALLAGCDAFLVKPCGSEELLAVLRACMSDRKTTSEIGSGA